MKNTASPTAAARALSRPVPSRACPRLSFLYGMLAGLALALLIVAAAI